MSKLIELLVPVLCVVLLYRLKYPAMQNYTPVLEEAFISNFMRADTSQLGRCQFSLLKANNVTACR